MSVLTSRRSSRSFQEKTVDKKVLDAILYAGLCAPSGMNVQDTKLVVFHKAETIAKLSELNR